MLDAKAKMDIIISGINPYSRTPSPNDSIPASMFFKANSTTLETAYSFYKPSTGLSTPSGFTKVNWVAGFTNTNNIYTSFLPSYPIFQANKYALYPIHTSIRNDNYMISQDYGY